MIQDLLNFASNAGIAIGADKAGHAFGRFLNRLSGKNTTPEQETAITKRIQDIRDPKVDLAIFAQKNIRASSQASHIEREQSLAGKTISETPGSAKTPELIGRTIFALGLVTLVALAVAVHIAGPLAGLALVKLSSPFVIPIAFVCTFVTAVLHAPIFAEPLALQLGIDANKANLATTIALGVAGALVIGLGAAIGGVPATQLLIVDTGSKLEVTLGMVTTLMLTSCILEFGQGIAEQGKGEVIPNMCYKDDIANGIQKATDAINNAPGQLARGIYDYGAKLLQPKAPEATSSDLLT